MARKKRPTKGPKPVKPLTWLQYCQLMWGTGPGSFGSEAEMQAAWEVNRDEIAADGWLDPETQHYRPGFRAYCWWLFDAPITRTESGIKAYTGEDCFQFKRLHEAGLLLDHEIAALRQRGILTDQG